MSERVKTYFAMLKGLSSEDLDRSVRELAAREKQDVARCIAHIAEIGERNLHLELGHGSLFEFCVIRLNLGEGTVYRRMQVARICRRFPEILEALFRGHLHLTGASLIAPHLTEENVENLINMAHGKTRREIEAFLVTLAPKEVFEPSVRKQQSTNPEVNDEKAEGGAPERTEPEEKPTPPSGGRRTRDLLEPATEDIKPTTEERDSSRFSAGNEFTEKYQRLAEVLGIENPHNHMEEIFEQALQCALEKKDPKRKLERRRLREARKQNPCVEEKQSKEPQRGETGRSPAVARQVSAEVRERVFEKAGHRCEYRGPDGARCHSRTGLQVEHTKPFSVYRTHDERYLRAFCPAHNLHAAEKFFGRQFIREKIDAARSEKEDRAGIPESEPHVSGAAVPR